VILYIVALSGIRANQMLKVPQPILDLFPLEDVVAKDQTSKVEPDSTSERLKRMGESLVWQKAIAPEDEEKGPELHRAGNFYRYYRSVDSLPDKAKVFYNKAGK
jgi:hypothetical protein